MRPTEQASTSSGAGFNRVGWLALSKTALNTYNPGKNFVNSKLYTQLTEFFHFNHCLHYANLNAARCPQ